MLKDILCFIWCSFSTVVVYAGDWNRNIASFYLEPGHLFVGETILTLDYVKGDFYWSILNEIWL